MEGWLEGGLEQPGPGFCALAGAEVHRREDHHKVGGEDGEAVDAGDEGEGEEPQGPHELRM